ncbi:MAG: hypothetical protein HQ519_05500 [Planctomycetes bacterium]|nr:hypothetical protein [Planctomycetota bacterium]
MSTEQPQNLPPACEHPECEQIHCRRLDRDRSVEKHTECPYCLGTKEEIQTGDHKKFCDFHEGKDPIHFGFPEDTSRHERG